MLKRLLWLSQCLIFSILGTFVLGFISRTITPILLVCVYHGNPTKYARNEFFDHSYLLLSAIYGFLLGLIPPHTVREVFSSMFASFRAKSLSSTPPVFRKPMLWAWLPIGTIFLIRFLTWQSPDRSVLAISSEGRFEHFFSSQPPGTLYFFRTWFYDRYLLTGPTLFLVSYSVAVWFRQQLPSSAEAQSNEAPDQPL